MKKIFITSFVLISLFGCGESGRGSKNNKTAEDTNKEEWSYQGETGPEFWKKLEKDSECGGIKQSPVNITTNQVVEGTFGLSPKSFHYSNATEVSKVINNGHTIEYLFESENNVLSYNGNDYVLKQYHFHAPSEHTIDGIRFPLEIHMVHASQESGQYVVFALLVTEGPSSKTFDFLLDYLPVEPGESKEVNSLHHFNDPLASLTSGTLFHYMGSLTTPPCTESVSWFVLKEPLGLAEDQIAVLTDLMPLNNYRDTQPLNQRKIEYKE